MLPHLIKRFIGQFLAPMPLLILLYLLGWGLQHVTRFKRIGRWVRGLSLLLFLAFGMGLGRLPLYELERRFPPFEPSAAECERLRGSDIVVMGQGLAPNSDLPVRFLDNDVFRARIMEAAYVAHRVPESRILVSMSGATDPETKRRALREYEFTFGLPGGTVQMFTDARDTEEEVAAALKLVRGPHLIVVTSAAHMDRTLLIFRRHQVDPNPAPCDYAITSPLPPSTWHRLNLPNARHWLHLERLFHEKLGGFYERLK